MRVCQCVAKYHLQIVKNHQELLKIIEKKVYTITKILEEFRKQYYDHQTNRSQQDSAIIEQLKQLNKKYFEWFQKERVAKDHMIDKVKVLIPPQKSDRVTEHQKIQEWIKNEISSLHKRIDIESSLRKETTDELLEQIKHYTDRIKNGIKSL